MKSLQIVTDRARKARDDFSLMLAKDVKDTMALQRQKKMLMEFRDEYMRALDGEMQQGMSSLDLFGYRTFLSSLDELIRQANDSIKKVGKRQESHAENWQRSHRELSRYEAVQKRRDAAARLERERQERKINDDLSTQMIIRRRMAAIG